MARVFTLSQNDYGKQTRWAQAPNENPSVQNLKNPSVQNLKIVQNLKNKEKSLQHTQLKKIIQKYQQDLDLLIG